jgi:hypothetical protein
VTLERHAFRALRKQWSCHLLDTAEDIRTTSLFPLSPVPWWRHFSVSSPVVGSLFYALSCLPTRFDCLCFHLFFQLSSLEIYMTEDTKKVLWSFHSWINLHDRRKVQKYKTTMLKTANSYIYIFLREYGESVDACKLFTREALGSWLSMCCDFVFSLLLCRCQTCKMESAGEQHF